MDATATGTWKDPYVGYDPLRVATSASACLACGDAPACMAACSSDVDIVGIVRLAGRAACEGLLLARWFQDTDQVEAARVTDMICDSYNG
jgi:NADPH-dependent glutamate synthase beta subunit-like oxidoreductase